MAACALVVAVLGVLGMTWSPNEEPPAAVNAECPVMLGKPVDAAIVVEHEGRRIAFCCERCRSKFLADPSKYLKNLPPQAMAPVAPGPARNDPRPGGAAARDPDTAGISAALFATNADDRFAARRRLRLALLPPAPTPPVPAIDGFDGIDAFIMASWELAGLPEAKSPPPLCDDATFLRRVFLDVIGAIPTIAETQAFLDDPSSGKRSQLIDALLSRDQDYADNWTAFWEDALGSSITGVNAGMATRGNYTRWINDSFRTNKPFDRFAAELLDPALPGHQPVTYGSDNGKPVRVHFVLNETHTDTLQTAAAVAQVFMGTAMKCASCHNHFENPEWPQRRFLAFASMFGERDLEVIRCESRSGQLAAAMFPFDIPGAPRDVPATEGERLTRVSQLLVDPLNPRFARAIVNRLWKRYLGLGLFEPVDDYREDIAVSQAALLDWLADDFMRHDYDLKHTIRLILNSRTYQAQFQPPLADAFDVTKPGAPRYFRSPALRRLTAEQLLDSISVAMTQRLESGSRAFRQVESTSLTRALGKPAIRNDISTARSEEPAILQGLELLNGDEYQAAINGRLLRDGMNAQSPEAAANVLTLAAFCRTPTDQQSQALASYLATNWQHSDRTDGAPIVRFWLDDDPPEGAVFEGSWAWSDTAAVSGTRSHAQGGDATPRAQHLLHVNQAWQVIDGDVLIAHVFIDPANPPQQIMLQWNDGTDYDGGWAHRAYWGENVIPFGENGTHSRRRIGDLPKAGEWARLEVPTATVGLGGDLSRVTGISFDQAGGRGGSVRWDAVGALAAPETPLARDMRDVLWALFTSAEFQYIR
jgi:hypothetical protein